MNGGQAPADWPEQIVERLARPIDWKFLSFNPRFARQRLSACDTAAGGWREIGLIERLNRVATNGCFT